MKGFIGLSFALIVAQGCGQLTLTEQNEANKFSVESVSPNKNELVIVDSFLSLKAAGDEEALKADTPAADKAATDKAAADEAAKAEAIKKLAGTKISSEMEKPTLARVTFELLPDPEAAEKSLSEKVVLEEKFPEDVSKGSIEAKAALKLRQGRSYKVVVEQLKDMKVLQTTALKFEFKKKSKQKLELATSQLSGVMLRYGKGSNEVMRECPAGQFMSGVGFNEIPICRAVQSTIVTSETAKQPAPVAPENKESVDLNPAEKKCCELDKRDTRKI
jgi:hypothetical protein